MRSDAYCPEFLGAKIILKHHHTMFGLGLPEIVLIVVAVVVLFFGGKKLSEFANGLGRFTGEFKKGKAEIEQEIKSAQETTIQK